MQHRKPDLMPVDLSIIIPVLYEQEIINHTLAGLHFPDSRYTCEVIVADGDPRGSTIRAIRNRDVIRLTAMMGRGSQMNAGARIAQGRVLLFLHADTTIPTHAPERIMEACASPAIVGGAFDLSIASSVLMLRIIARAASLRSRLTRIPYGDQAIFIKKSFFTMFDGFAQIPIMEDIELMRRIRRAGHRIIILPDRVSTSARRWEKNGICFTSIRNLIISTFYYLGVSPERLKRFY
jgi:rSAM/selenodomain-associated transferase 2